MYSQLTRFSLLWKGAGGLQHVATSNSKAQDDFLLVITAFALFGVLFLLVCSVWISPLVKPNLSIFAVFGRSFAPLS